MVARGKRGYRRGHTLPELCSVLLVVGVLLGLVAPRVGASRDRWASQAAARDVALILSTARQIAATTVDGAAVHFDDSGALVRLVVGDVTVRTLDLAEVHGVALRATRDSLAYDARGLGHGAANLSVMLSRGAAAETVVVSRLGRLRRSGVY